MTIRATPKIEQMSAPDVKSKHIRNIYKHPRFGKLLNLAGLASELYIDEASYNTKTVRMKRRIDGPLEDMKYGKDFSDEEADGIYAILLELVDYIKSELK